MGWWHWTCSLVSLCFAFSLLVADTAVACAAVAVDAAGPYAAEQQQQQLSSQMQELGVADMHERASTVSQQSMASSIGTDRRISTDRRVSGLAEGMSTLVCLAG